MLSLRAIAYDHAIALVHIGTAVPKYLPETLSQIRCFNKDCPLYLLANESIFPQLAEEKRINNITLIALEKLKKTTEHVLFVKNSKKNKKHRDFWIYTKERFLYLFDFMSQYQKKHIFHIENDNMLYVDLSELMPVFIQNYPSLGVTFTNDIRCIAGFVYVRDSASLQKLASFFAQQAKYPKNDMELLAMLKEKDANSITPLPIIMEEYVKNEPLKSPLGHTSSNPNRFTHLF